MKALGHIGFEDFGLGFCLVFRASDLLLMLVLVVPELIPCRWSYTPKGLRAPESWHVGPNGLGFWVSIHSLGVYLWTLHKNSTSTQDIGKLDIDLGTTRFKTLQSIINTARCLVQAYAALLLGAEGNGVAPL